MSACHVTLIVIPDHFFNNSDILFQNQRPALLKKFALVSVHGKRWGNII